MQKIVDCVLEINRIINDKEEKSIINGRGYYKEEDGGITIFFSSDNVKYKYIYKYDMLTIFCNDSKYTFKENVKDKGQIKNGDYIFEITTLASKIEINNNYIIVNYSLYQQDLIGTYLSKLSFN